MIGNAGGDFPPDEALAIVFVFAVLALLIGLPFDPLPRSKLAEVRIGMSLRQNALSVHLGLKTSLKSRDKNAAHHDGFTRSTCTATSPRAASAPMPSNTRT
jgi:hypothetical protein